MAELLAIDLKHRAKLGGAQDAVGAYTRKRAALLAKAKERGELKNEVGRSDRRPAAAALPARFSDVVTLRRSARTCIGRAGARSWLPRCRGAARAQASRA